MENALYYTLSTVSQTLAGALGMLAAFLALRVSTLDTRIRERLRELFERTHALDLGNCGAREALSAWGAWIASCRDPRAKSVLRAFGDAERDQQSRDRLLRGVRRALIASACVMGACFTGLASSPWLALAPGRAIGALCLAILGGVACLVWYGLIVRGALE